MKYLILFISFLLFSCTTSQTLMERTVLVNARGGGYGFGDQVLTCYHLVDASDTVLMITYSGDIIIGYVIKKAPENDLAIISTGSPRFDETILFGDYRMGSPIFAIGHPMGLDWTTSYGRVEGMFREVFGIPTFQVSLPSTGGGSSGSPIFNRKGELIGILSSMISNNSIRFVIPRDTIINFIKNE